MGPLVSWVAKSTSTRCTADKTGTSSMVSLAGIRRGWPSPFDALHFSPQ